MEKYEIKIQGSGTQDQIVSSLQFLIDTLKTYEKYSFKDGVISVEMTEI